MKQQLKALLVWLALLPAVVAEFISKLIGKSYYLRGDVFDTLLQRTTTVSNGKGGTITFQTPNRLTLYRARTLLEKEPETLEWIDGFEPNSVLWDIGANVGVYSLYAASTNPGTRVFAFEPSIENLFLLNKNISQNNLYDRITVFPLALSDASGSNLFQHQKLQFGGALNSYGVDYSHDGKPSQFTVRYKVFGFRGDDLAAQFGIQAPNYLKLDVDGIEHLIVRGAKQVLSSPTLKSALIELNFDFASQRDEVIALMQSYGLVLKEFKHADAYYGDGGFSQIYNHIFVRRAD